MKNKDKMTLKKKVKQLSRFQHEPTSIRILNIDSSNN